MLTAEENELLCRVGPDTPMGALMRRYWQPIAAVSELAEESPVKPVRILGEDLALYRDLRGGLGLIDLYCPHRLRPLSYGIPEEDGLRCPYTGWLFDGEGRCLDIPFEPEDSTMKYEVRTRAYPAQELGGLIWAYLGPAPAPLIPHWDLLVAENAFRQIGHSVLSCNWLQCMESAVDPVDNPYLSSEYARDLGDRRHSNGGRGAQRRPSAATRARVRSEFERNAYGIVQRCRVGEVSSPLLTLGEGQGEDIGTWVEAHPLIFPVMVRAGSGFRQELQIRVPLDDTHTWNLRYQCFLPGERVKVRPQESIPLFEVPLKDESGEFIFNVGGIRDMVLWVSQGEMLDRTREHLAEGDKGLTLYRRILQQQVAIVEDGGEPMNVFRTSVEMGPGIDLKPKGEQAILPGRSFAPETAQEDVERYSPALGDIKRLYRRMQRAEAKPPAATKAPRRAKRSAGGSGSES